MEKWRERKEALPEYEKVGYTVVHVAIYHVLLCFVVVGVSNSNRWRPSGGRDAVTIVRRVITFSSLSCLRAG